MKAYTKAHTEVREKMKNIGMTYAELAHRIGRSESWVKRVLTGRADPRLSDYCKMLSEVGLTAGRLRII